ncbi:alpha/beta fold hydrolase [Saccharopolyspora gloriosae]|uniref:Surfactin synthase thioesterase subunit n=1 Tax=Saccharopolyspora gloriosae TaxID=455344 RepID=A0A840NPJ7_9PSEU|nr:alpha/beta fold hydrolase [Saccharopolyspora gloriosae]MBB5071895.1 surfactin synthase thioesterase subunit [Saccharopolyspora gloriosae]
MTGIADDTGAWIRRFHPAAAPGPRLVCFPHAGGAASYYFPMSKALAPDVEVLAVQYPGRQDRRAEPCLTSVEEIAERALDGLRGWAAEGPLTLFGHSMGASVAFEVARRLEAGGTPVRALFASGRAAPHRTRNEGVHALDDQDFVAALTALDGSTTAVLANEELLRMVMPSLRADYRAAETYTYRPGSDVSCPVVALIGADDPKVTADEASAWQERTSGSFELHTFPGAHFYLNAEAEAVQRVIRKHV